MEVTAQLYFSAIYTIGKCSRYPLDRRLDGPLSRSGNGSEYSNPCPFQNSNHGRLAHSPLYWLREPMRNENSKDALWTHVYSKVENTSTPVLFLFLGCKVAEGWTMVIHTLWLALATARYVRKRFGRRGWKDKNWNGSNGVQKCAVFNRTREEIVPLTLLAKKEHQLYLVWYYKDLPQLI